MDTRRIETEEKQWDEISAVFFLHKKRIAANEQIFRVKFKQIICLDQGQNAKKIEGLFILN